MKKKKADSLHVPAIKLIGKKQLVKKVPIILLKLRFLWIGYVKFGEISKKWYFVNTALLKFESKNPFAHMWHL